MTCWKFKKKIAECINRRGDIELIEKENFKKNPSDKNQKAPTFLG